MTPQETIKILKPLFEHCKGKNECLGYIEHFFTKDEEEALDMAIKALEQQPKTGHWIVIREEFEFMGGIVNEPRGCKCSNCNKVVRFKTDFCPNCGARMEVEE